MQMQLQPPCILVMGQPGCGKTDSLATLLASELETFVISTEPDGIASLLDSCARRGVSINNLHWTSVMPATPGWSALSDMVTTIGTMGFEEIAKLKTGVGKADTRQPAMKLLNTLANFKCERTGEAFGDVTKWGDNRVLVLDSLSGLNIISMMLTLGYKPSAHQGEWGVAMNFIEQLLLKITSDRGAFFVLNAHVEKEINEISGINQIMIATLGRKLAPKIPRFFSEVVYAKRTLRDGKAAFTWSTADTSADLKNRSLPISNDLVQDYKPIVDAYRRRRALAMATPPTMPQEGAKPAGASAPAAPIAPTMRPPAATQK